MNVIDISSSFLLVVACERCVHEPWIRDSYRKNSYLLLIYLVEAGNSVQIW